MHSPLKPTRRHGGQSLWFTLGLLAATGANANPQGAQVVHGSAVFMQPNPQVLEITNSPSAILNWQSFDIAVGETTRFLQQNAASAVLNRVTTQNSSEIFGNLLSNGQVFLINPAGILIGRDATVDTAGLVMSTLNMTDEDFLAGRLRFSGDETSGALVNRGYIKSGPGGEIILIAPHITNEALAGRAESGLIESDDGTLILAAGETITIASLDDPDISFEVQAPEHEVVNLGKLLADGGTVGVLAGTILQAGQISADTMTIDDAGRVLLAASSRVVLEQGSLTSATSSGGGDGGEVEISAHAADASGRIYQMGSVRADGNAGGQVALGADRILATGSMSARGAVDGGQVTVTAADEIIATSSSFIDVSGGSGAGGTAHLDGGDGAFSSGQIQATGMTGGDVQVLGDDVTLAAATIDATGSTGGGRVRIGGGYQGGEGLRAAQDVEINDSTVIKADADVVGKGGSVVVWSDGSTRYAGTISARGGEASGDGGEVEVSGKTALGFTGRVDVGATNGTPGTLLFDPKNLHFTSENLSGVPISVLDPHPGANNNFGQTIQFIDANGFNTSASFAVNLVVYDVEDDFGAMDAGAVYVYRMSDGSLLSSLTGGNAGDAVGNNFLQNLSGFNVLRSTLWNGSRGAVTVFDAVNGTSGVVDSSNSLVGVNAGDQIGSAGVQGLGGALGVLSPQFEGTRGALTIASAANLRGTVSTANSLVGANVGDFFSQSGLVFISSTLRMLISSHGTKGAVTFIDVNAPATGTVGAANSLVGVNAGDNVGQTGVDSLASGRYAVRSAGFNGGRGALTVVDIANPLTAQVSTTNSLVGANIGDNLGTQPLIELGVGNGHYVQRSTHGTLGAVTFINPLAPVTGTVSDTNSLVGVSAFDNVGADGITLTTNNTYAVRSADFAGGRGALTFASRSTGIVGQVSTTNSLVGANIGDQVGIDSFFNLSGGNYLYRNPHGTLGAVTFINPTSAPTGTVGSGNSLVGTSAGDNVGSDIDLLDGTAYAVLSPDWNSATGAMTVASNASGISGPIGAGNSLLGAFVGDQLGSNGLDDLDNGNFVLISTNGGFGAVTFFDPGAPVTGVVGGANSLVGALTTDEVGSGGIDEVGGSLWAVFSPNWDASAILTEAGAVTLFDAASGNFAGTATPLAGIVSSGNSLVGDSANDQVGGGGIDFVFGSTYAVFSPLWDDGGFTDRGAITWFTLGALNGLVSAANSLTGAFSGDVVGASVNDAIQGFAQHGIYDLDNGNAVLKTPNYNSDGGAVTFLADDGSPPVGAIGIGNSLVGAPNDLVGDDGIEILSNLATHYFVLSSSWSGNTGAVTIANAASGVTGLVSGANSVVGVAPGDQVGSGGIIPLLSDNALIHSPQFQASRGAVTFVDLNNERLLSDTDFANTVSSSNSLIGAAANDDIGSAGIYQFYDGDTGDYYYGVFSPAFALGTGAVTFANSDTGIGAIVGSGNSITGSAPGDQVGLGANYHQLDSYKVLLLNPQWNNDRGAVTFVDLGTSSVTGQIDDTNSVIGSTDGDMVGSDGIEEIFDQSFNTVFYAILSPEWINDGLTEAGAITWGDPFNGVTGAVTGLNSLVGGHTNDRIGDCCSLDQVTGNLWVAEHFDWDGGKSALTFFDVGGMLVDLPVGEVDMNNSLLGSTIGDALGNSGIFTISTTGGTWVVVESPNWSNVGADNAGAITVFRPEDGINGVLGDTNSLVGSQADDFVGGGDFPFHLPSSGHRLFVTPTWNNDRGAVTFWNTNAAITGIVGIGNSLVGGTDGDLIGNWDYSTTSGGRYYVAAPDWNGDMGAITFGSQATGFTGVVSAANSLVGSTALDRVGENLFAMFGTDNLISIAEDWNGNAGAVTSLNPLAPHIGAVSAANSLIGSAAGDRVGDLLTFLFQADNDGLLVLRSTAWNSNSGAVTIYDPDSPLIGAVSSANSLVGRPGDLVGNGGITEFGNGNLLVRSNNWSDGLGQNFGAVTLMHAASPVTPVVGFVSSANSLVGSHANDQVGNGSFNTLPTGNIILRSPNWNSNAGALTFININDGRTGVVSGNNSLIGELPNDFIGGGLGGGISFLGGDRYLVRSPIASVNGIAGAGRLDIVDGATTRAVNGDIGFDSSPGGELFVSIQSVINFLNTGATLKLQATNDIFIPIGGGFVAENGALFLEAGRSIDIAGDLIVRNGSLSLLANAPLSDAAFRDAGSGDITVHATDTSVLVLADILSVEAQNILLEAGTAPGASVALVGFGTTKVHAHGSGLLSLTAGTAPDSGLAPGSSFDIFERYLNAPADFTAPAAFIIGREGLAVIADDVVLNGGGSAGAFAALASFGEFSVEAINIELTPGIGDNADAVLLGLGGLADISYSFCNACDSLFGDPLLDPLPDAGIFISGVLQNPAGDAILAMLGRDGGDDSDDDDEDDEEEETECN